jgi:hypothetical protein
MQKMRQTMDGGMKDMPHSQAVSPVDRAEALAQRLSDSGAAINKVGDAAETLYASLQLFRLLV